MAQLPTAADDVRGGLQGKLGSLLCEALVLPLSSFTAGLVVLAYGLYGSNWLVESFGLVLVSAFGITLLLTYGDALASSSS